MSRRVPLLMGIATVAALWATQGGVGFVRDEGYYFTAAQSYEEWLRLLGHSPLEALRSTARYWSYNFEHPGLLKLLFAASHLLFARWLPDAVAWRLPAWIFGGLLTYWLARLGQRRSAAAGVLAPLIFWCAERPFFNGHLAAFDVPICALAAGVAVAWLRAIEEPGRRSDLWLAFIYGCALASKHNAWLFPLVLLVHGLLVRRPRPLLWLLLSPLVLFAAWPLLWHEPLRHLRDWIAFHLHHVHYAWWYMGSLLREPPFPVAYPAALLALTLPLPTVALLGAALLRLFADFLRRRLEPDRLLQLGFAAAALLPFMLRTTPIFGGIKHWLSTIAFLAPEAAALLCAAAGAVRWRHALPAVAALALLPGLVQIARVHPYGTSAYGELAGGIPGAASLGMQRQFWSNNVTGVLPWLNAHAPRGARVFFHEVNVESHRAYQQAGQLRADIRYAWSPRDADYAALQWHREFRDREPETWNAFGTRRPATGLYIDEVPQVVVYARPGLPGAR